MNSNPYSSIKTHPLEAPNGEGLLGVSVYVPDSTRQGWRQVGSVERGQPLLPNNAMRHMALNIAGTMPIGWREVKVFFDGAHFAYALAAQDGPEANVEGATLSLGLLFRNSYDGSWSPSMHLMAYEQDGQFGVLSEKHLPSASFRGTHHTDTWEADRERAIALLRSGNEILNDLTRRLRKLAGWTLSKRELHRVRPLWPSGVPSELWGLLTFWLLQGRQESTWALLRRLLRRLWRKGESAEDVFNHNAALTDGLLTVRPGHDEAR